jgi:nitroreductase
MKNALAAAAVLAAGLVALPAQAETTLRITLQLPIKSHLGQNLEAFEQEVGDDIITKILDAGRRSQSSKNVQPWHFIVVKDRAKLQALSQTGAYTGHLAGAAFAILLASSDDQYWIAYDLGQAAAYLQLAAWELGVGSCIASIYEPDKAKAILDVPMTMDLKVALSFGYPAEEHKPTKMGGRKPLADIVHYDGW